VNASTARLSLRYRPGPDVLFGHVEHDVTTEMEHLIVSDSPNDDTVIQWTRVDHTSTEEVLSSFQIINAADAVRDDDQLALPVAVLPLVRTLVELASERIDTTDTILGQLRTLTESTTELPLSSLTRR